MDLTKIESIIFLAVAGALAAFFLVSVFVVVAKGKRKCGAFDIVLRIVAAVVLFVSAIALTASVMTALDGPFSINAETSVITLWSFTATLPLPELFVILSAALGRNMCIVVVLLSMLALVCDCLIANAKTKKPEKVKKSAEEIKRQAQIDKIRSLGASAVKKTGEAASNASSSEEKASDVENEKADAQNEDEPEFDWRVSSAPEKKEKEFIGIGNSSDDDFGLTEESEEAQSDEYKEYDEPTEEVYDESDETNDEADKADGFESYADDDETETDGEPDEFTSQDEDGFEKSEYEEVVNTADPDKDIKDDEDEEPWYALGGDKAEPFETEEVVETNSRDRDYEENEREQAYSAAPAAEPYAEREEVNRDIYIPKMRVIERSRAEKPAEPKKQKPTVKSAAKTAGKTTAKKPAENRQTAKRARKPAEKPTVKAVNPPTKSAKKSDTAVNRSLPVTRKYVILDKTSAVNIFSDYLKERDKDEKNKLESSISTIIIK